MPESLDDFLMKQAPTAERPLLGQTVLIVEDSRFACEALRLICQRSGARIRRADTLAAAKRHLGMYRPGIVLVDIGLPDGSGLDLIRSLAAAEPRIGVIMAMSGDDDFAPVQATLAGANGFIEKPILSVIAFQKRILLELPADSQPTTLRPVGDDEVIPDALGLRDDLSLAAELLGPEPDGAMLDYITAFLIGVAKSAKDTALQSAVREVAKARRDETDLAVTEVSCLRTLIDDRLREAAAV